MDHLFDGNDVHDDDDVRETLYKEKTSTYNRLRSIHEDSGFVARVCQEYPGLPVAGKLCLLGMLE